MTSYRGDSTYTATTHPSIKALQSAATLGNPESSVMPSYTIDSGVEGLAVDNTDKNLDALDLGKKYSDIFGNAEFVFINMPGTMFEDMQDPLKPYPGTLQSYKALREHDLKLVFMANSWKTSKNGMVEMLNAGGFDIQYEDIFTSSDVCKKYLQENNIKRPYYLAHTEVMKDFADDYPRRPQEDSVIVGLPSTQFDYRLLSKGMDLLSKGSPLIVLNMMKRTRTPTIQNTFLGPGPFISMLTSCIDTDPITVCKPSQIFYEAMCEKVGCTDYSKGVVIGDDIIEDISGAKALGLKAILTRTGHYQLNDEKMLCAGLAPDATVESFSMAVRCVVAASAVSNMTDDDYKEEERLRKGCGNIDSTPKKVILTRKMAKYASQEDNASYGDRLVRLPSFIW